MRGTLTAPKAGTYTFALTGDDAAQAWLSDDESPYNRHLLLDLEDNTDFRDLSNPNVPFAEVNLSSNQTCYVEILLKEASGGDHVTLWWKRPGNENLEIITWEYLRSYVQPADDTERRRSPK